MTVPLGPAGEPAQASRVTEMRHASPRDGIPAGCVSGKEHKCSHMP